MTGPLDPSMRVLVTGAGGFIGHHLVERLVADGHRVRGVDVVEPEFSPSAAQEFLVADLREADAADTATRDVDLVFALAADMGGMGFISANHSAILHNNTLIDAHTIEAARRNGAQRYLYTSTACVYPMHLQSSPDVTPLREEDAWPADPEPGYGFEKLAGEQFCRHYGEDHPIETRVARLHNVYGPLGTWTGGREKVPAALCRKVAVAKLTGVHEIEIWGDGRQTRSFCFVEDCVEGLVRLMASDHADPINLGTERMITVDGLADVVAAAAGIEVVKRHVPGPQGVRGRNSDNTTLREVLDWEPQVTLEDGIARTYEWIEARVREATP